MVRTLVNIMIDHNSEQYQNNYISVLYMVKLHNIVHIYQYMSILPDIVHDIALVWFADAGHGLGSSEFQVASQLPPARPGPEAAAVTS